MSSTSDSMFLGKDHWAASDIGARYRQGEKMTAPAAVGLLKQSGVIEATKRGEPVRLLDNACGPGVLSSAYHAAIAGFQADGAKLDYQVTCADFSEGMVASAEERAKEEGWKNTEFKVADAQDTKLPSSHYTHVLTSLGFGIFPNSDAALDEVDRMLVPGGTLGITTWHYLGWPLLIQRGLELAGSSLVLPDMLSRYKALTGYDWASVEAIEALLASRGYADIQVRKLPSTATFSKAEIIHGDTGKTSIKIIMGLVAEEEREKWQDKILPALAENWERLHAETGGLSITEMVPVYYSSASTAQRRSQHACSKPD